jgi:hypothetical protein
LRVHEAIASPAHRVESIKCYFMANLCVGEKLWK